MRGYHQMIKRTVIATIISLFFVSYANAWEMDAYVENTPISESHVDTNSRTNQDTTSATKADSNQKTDNQKDYFRHHSIGIEYNFLTLTDFGTSLGHLFDDKCEDIFECSYGAISINYGYIFSNNIETGLIANISLTKNPLYSLMGKFKFNGSDPGSFVNLFFEIDLGIIINGNEIAPMGHISLFGFEIGHPISLRFQIPFLLWGQRGLTYLGVGYRF